MERRHWAKGCLQGRAVQFSESLIPAGAWKLNEVCVRDQQILQTTQASIKGEPNNFYPVFIHGLTNVKCQVAQSTINKIKEVDVSQFSQVIHIFVK